MQPVPEGPAAMVQSAPPLDAPAPAMGVGGVPPVDVQTAPSPMPIPDTTPAGLSPTSEGTNFVVPPTFSIDKGVLPPPAPEIPGLSAMPTARTDATAVIAPNPPATPDIPGMTSPPVTAAPLSADTSVSSQLSDVQNTGGISPAAEAVSSTPPTIDWKPPASVMAGVDQAPQPTVSPVPPVEETVAASVTPPSQETVVAPVIPAAPPEVTPAPVATEGTDTVVNTAWKPDAPVVTNTENPAPSNVSVSTTTDAAPSGTDSAIGTTGWNNGVDTSLTMSSQQDEVVDQEAATNEKQSSGFDLRAVADAHVAKYATKEDEAKAILDEAARLKQKAAEMRDFVLSEKGTDVIHFLEENGWTRPTGKPEPTPLPVSEPLKQAA